MRECTSSGSVPSRCCPRRRPLSTRIPCATPNLSIFETYRYHSCTHTKKKINETLKNKSLKHLRKHLKNIWEQLQTYATFRWNTYKHTYETPENTWNICLQHACICNIQIKHLQHSSKTDETFRNIHLKHTFIAITTCVASRSTLTTSIYNTYNIPMKHLKHLKHIIATCAFSSIYLLLGRREACRRKARRRRRAWCRGVVRAGPHSTSKGGAVEGGVHSGAETCSVLRRRRRV
jgi:hypothetical protein